MSRDGRTGSSRHIKLRHKLIHYRPLICAYCGIDLDPTAPPQTTHAIELDHIIPVSKGGTDDESNLALACWQCNISKSSKSFSVLPPKKKMLTNRKW